VTSKEIATVINMQVEAANNAYEDAARGGETDVSEERCIADATHAELLKALYEIAYQLAVQNERGEWNVAFQQELKGMIETKLDEFHPTGNNSPSPYTPFIRGV
jgi:hypothetical protein